MFNTNSASNVGIKLIPMSLSLFHFSCFSFFLFLKKKKDVPGGRGGRGPAFRKPRREVSGYL